MWVCHDTPTNFIIFPSQSKHKLPHPPKHDDDSPIDSHKVWKCCEADDSRHEGKPDEKPDRYNEIHSRDNPSDNIGRRLSDSFRQRICYELPTEALLSSALSAPILQGRRVHCPYLVE